MKIRVICLILIKMTYLDAQMTGFAEHWEALPAGPGSEFQQRRDRLKLSAVLQYSSLKTYVSGELTQDSFSEPALYWRWREAYTEWQGSVLGFRGGIQLVSWGRTRYVFLLDHINPRDWRYSYTWSLSDIRQGLPLVRGRLSLSGKDLEILWIPRYVEDLPVDRGPWSVADADIRFIDNYSVLFDEHKPISNRKNEIGVRLAGRLAGIDYRLMYFSGYQDEPVPTYDETIWLGEAGDPNSDVIVSYHKDHPRQEMIGVDFQAQWRGFTLTGELGRQTPYIVTTEPAFDTTNHFGNKRYRADRFLGMVGLRVNLPANIRLGGQLITRQYSNSASDIPPFANQKEATISFAAPLPGLGMEGEIWHYTSLTSTSQFTQGSVTWQYTRQIQLQAGITLINAEPDAPFGPFINNDHFFLIARIVF